MKPSAEPTPQFLSTGSSTIADMLGIAASRYADVPAIRHKRGDQWTDVSYRELSEIVTEIGLGLIDLGIMPGQRVCILCNTRAEWTYADLAITISGATVVPIYPTNSPEECEWVVANSEAVAVVCEDASQVAKIVQMRDRLPLLRYLIVVDPAGHVADAITLEEMRGRGRCRDAAALRERTAAVIAEDAYTFIYTSGTTGPPKGCVLTHGNYRHVLDMCHEVGVMGSNEVVYLFLPLAHAFALLIQLLCIDVGATMAFWSGDPQKIVPELQEVKPSYFPSVPRIFEKIYTLSTAAMTTASPEDQEQFHAAVKLGVKVRDLENGGHEIPQEFAAPFALAEERIFSNVRAMFGGNLRQAVTGAAPIAPDTLEFFYACGVPVLEAYGMTETSTVSTYSTPRHHRFGSVGRALPRCQIRIADDGEILIKGPHVFRGYYRKDDVSLGVIDGWLHTGDLGRVDDDGYLHIIGRKKDIIITGGGEKLTPANLENDMKQCRWISQAVMHGKSRPYPVMLITLDEEEIMPWASARGLPTDLAILCNEPSVHALVQAHLDRANSKYTRGQQVKRFAILPHDFTQIAGELTPTMKVKRNVVEDTYAALFDSLYD